MTYDELMKSILTAQEEMLKYKIEANSVTLNGRKYGKLIENCPANMKPTIFGMAAKVAYDIPDDYDFLVQYEPPQPKTNADRIRSMTDEELVEFLAPYNSGCPKEHGSVMACHELGCYKCWSIWLKKEVRE